MKNVLDNHYWDSIVEKIDNRIFEKNVAVYYKSEHIQLIKKWGEGLKGKKILKTDLFEEAFKDGDFLFWLLRQNENTFGMDISCAIVKKARDNSRELNFKFDKGIASDIRNCAFGDESFDLIISNSTLDNLSFGDVSGALGELRRILKPKGILILTLDNRNNPLYYLGYLIEKIIKTNKYYQARCYSRSDIEVLAKQNNFLIKDTTAIVHIPTPFNKIALFLGRFGGKPAQKFIRWCVISFSKLGYKKTKFFTGWFIAVKLIKNNA